MSAKLERIIYIDQQIRADNFPNPSSVAERFEVSERSVADDRRYMIDRLGAPIEFDKEMGGWYYTDETWVLPATIITEGELLALFLGQVVSQQYLGTPFEQKLQDGLAKISKYLPDKVRLDLAEASRCYTVNTGFVSSVNSTLMQKLQLAIREHRQFWMRYYTASRGERRERTVNPYHLYLALGHWYLIAYDQWRAEIRNFRLERIEEWRVLNQYFEPDPSFLAQDYIAKGFFTSMGKIYDVIIQFDEYQARYIREQRWHSTQEPLKELADGSVILHFQSGGLDAIQRWVMQYGSHAQVLAPPELRESVAEEVSRMRQLYTD